MFGEAVIANALYMVRVSSNLEKGLQYATGMDLPCCSKRRAATTWTLQVPMTCSLPWRRGKIGEKHAKTPGCWTCPFGPMLIFER